MKFLSTLQWLVLVCGSFTLPVHAKGQDGPLDPGLRDVDCVAVEVESRGELPAPITRDELQTTLELTLRRNGIAVGCAGPGSIAGRLRLEVVTLTLDEGITGVPRILYAATVLLEFSRYIRTEIGEVVWASPWFRYRTTCCAPRLVRERIPSVARTLAEGFANQVLAVRQRSGRQ